MSLKTSYAIGDELLASYGPHYLRTYSSRGFVMPPPTARVPPDAFLEAHRRSALWPVRVPAWWNLDMQPQNRPALRRLEATNACGRLADELADDHSGGALSNLMSDGALSNLMSECALSKQHPTPRGAKPAAGGEAAASVCASLSVGDGHVHMVLCVAGGRDSAARAVVFGREAGGTECYEKDGRCTEAGRIINGGDSTSATYLTDSERALEYEVLPDNWLYVLARKSLPLVSHGARTRTPRPTALKKRSGAKSLRLSKTRQCAAPALSEEKRGARPEQRATAARRGGGDEEDKEEDEEKDDEEKDDDEEEEEEDDDDDEMVTQSDGVLLYLSRKSRTGYRGVRQEGSRFRAESRGVSLGTYDTAVEAAAAYAKQQSDEEEGVGDDEGAEGEEAAVNLEEEEGECAAEPFETNLFETPGHGYQTLPCPARLPMDLECGALLARWFGHPYNIWSLGHIVKINRRRTHGENVTAQFSDERWGTTWGHFTATQGSYGKLWVLLAPVAVDMDSDEDEERPLLTPAGRIAVRHGPSARAEAAAAAAEAAKAAVAPTTAPTTAVGGTKRRKVTGHGRGRAVKRAHPEKPPQDQRKRQACVDNLIVRVGMSVHDGSGGDGSGGGGAAIVKLELTPRTPASPSASLEPVERAGGYVLELSATSNTGYRGVTQLFNGASAKSPFLALGYGHVALGHFASALEAAVAVARYRREAGVVGVGAAVRVTGGLHAGGEGVVTGSTGAWMKVRLAGGEAVSVRMMHLAVAAEATDEAEACGGGDEK